MLTLNLSSPLPKYSFISSSLYPTINKISLIPASFNPKIVYSNNGLPARGIIGLGREEVIGINLFPFPAANMTAFIKENN
ncbi:hypothetical protein ES705_08798 [subsurface metagenome]